MKTTYEISFVLKSGETKFIRRKRMIGFNIYENGKFMEFHPVIKLTKRNRKFYQFVK